MKGETPKPRRGDVTQVRSGTRPAVDRHLVPLALHAVHRVRVAARRVAHDFERELGRDRAGRRHRRAATAVRSGTGRARAAASATRDRRPADRDNPCRRSRRRSGPYLCCLASAHDARQRERHAVGGLMARHAGAAVRAERLEERVAFGGDGAARIENAEPSRRVRVLDVRGQRAILTGRPPLARDAAASGRRLRHDRRSATPRAAERAEQAVVSQFRPTKTARSGHCSSPHELARDEPFVHPLRPRVDGQALLAHAESRADAVVDVDLRGLAGRFPGSEQREAAVRHVEVGRADRDEQRRRVGGHAHVLQRRPVDGNEKIGRRIGFSARAPCRPPTPPPAENPMMPTRIGSTFQRVAFRRTRRSAACASATANASTSASAASSGAGFALAFAI